MLAAVIGIGSNSVRALVARNNEGVFERLYRDREGTRLFAGLDSRGVLKEESILKTDESLALLCCQSLDRYLCPHADRPCFQQPTLNERDRSRLSRSNR